MRWRIVDEPVQCCLGMCCEGTIVNEDHVTIKYSFEFGLGTEVAYVEEFRCGYEVTLPEEASKAEDRRREKKIPKSVSWLRHSPVSSKHTVPVMFSW